MRPEAGVQGLRHVRVFDAQTTAVIGPSGAGIEFDRSAAAVSLARRLRSEQEKLFGDLPRPNVHGLFLFGTPRLFTQRLLVVQDSSPGRTLGGPSASRLFQLERVCETKRCHAVADESSAGCRVRTLGASFAPS